MYLELLDITFIIERIWNNSHLKQIKEIDLDQEQIPNQVKAIK